MVTESNDVLKEALLYKAYSDNNGKVLYIDTKTQQTFNRIFNTTGITNFLEAIKLVTDLINSQDTLISSNSDIARSSLAQRIIQLLITHNPYKEVSDFFPRHQKHPYFEFLIRQIKVFQRALSAKEISDVDLCNKFINRIKSKFQTTLFKEQLNLNATHAQKNYKSLYHYTNQLISFYPNLVIIKVNIYYNFYFTGLINHPLTVDKINFYPILDAEKKHNLFISPHLLNIKHLLFRILNEQYITYEEAKIHREHFFKQIKKQVFGKYFVGYAWKMDHNNQKGYFNDLLLFFNTTIMPTAILEKLPNLLNDYWHNTITHGLGVCKFAKIETTQAVDKPKDLDNVINNMTLLDEYIRFVAPLKQDRTFNRGRISPKKVATLAKQAKEQANYWQDL